MDRLRTETCEKRCDNFVGSGINDLDTGIRWVLPERKARGREISMSAIRGDPRFFTGRDIDLSDQGFGFKIED